MNNASLALSQSPALSVPLRFFLTAPLFVIACGVVLFWYGPEAIESRWHPAILAATHFLTLGFLGMIMMGALQQLAPVLMGAQILQPVLFSAVTHILLTAGTVALTAAWLLHQPFLFSLAGILLGLAITIFIVVLLFSLSKARSGYATVTATKIALIAFAITMILGGYLVMGYSGSALTRLPGMTNLHMTWGLVGWVSLLLMGVAYQVVPMFQITPEYPKPMTRWLSIIMFIILLCWSVVQVFYADNAGMLNFFTALLVISLLGFAIATLYLLSHRRRNIPDITLNFWRVSMASLIMVILVWVLSLFDLHHRMGLFITVAMIVGFAMSAVNGMLYKITPFLIWLHLNNYAQGKDRTVFKIPNMKQVIPEQKTRLHFRVYSFMLLLSYLAVFWPEYFLRPAALLLIVSALLLYKNIYFALRVYKYHSTKN